MSGIYGLIVILPLYFMETRFGVEHPPAVTHPELYYGFIGLVVVWQLAFLLIATDVLRYRPLIPIAIGEKVIFFIPCVLLFNAGRIDTMMFGAACADLIWAVLFAFSWAKSGGAGGSVRGY